MTLSTRRLLAWSNMQVGELLVTARQSRPASTQPADRVKITNTVRKRVLYRLITDEGVVRPGASTPGKVEVF